METPKIQELQSLLEMMGDVSGQFESVEKLEVRMQGFNPDEIRFLAKRYESRFRMPDATVNRYRTSFGVGLVQMEVMSDEYRINYSFAPLNSKVRSSWRRKAQVEEQKPAG